MTTSVPAHSATRSPTILVVGMHRSGTSALARIVNLMGAFVGSESELVPAHPSINPVGHWERMDVVVEQDRFLQNNGFGWGTLANFDFDKIADEQKRELAAKLRTIIGGMGRRDGAPLLLKDPRMCLLLPVWENVAEEPVYVVVVRDPRKVAASVMAAYPASFTTDFLLALWQKYLQSALSALRGKKALFIAYEHLLQDAPAQHDRLLHGLHMLGAGSLIGLPWERLHSEFDAKLDRSEPSPHARLSEDQRRIYDWLVAQCENPDPVTVADFPVPPPPDAVLAELEAVRRACLRNGWQMAMMKQEQTPG